MKKGTAHKFDTASWIFSCLNMQPDRTSLNINLFDKIYSPVDVFKTKNVQGDSFVLIRYECLDDELEEVLTALTRMQLRRMCMLAGDEQAYILLNQGIYELYWINLHKGIGNNEDGAQKELFLNQTEYNYNREENTLEAPLDFMYIHNGSDDWELSFEETEE